MPVPVAPPAGGRYAAALDYQLHRIAQACDERNLDVRGAFRIFDSNGDGFVTRQEFKYAVAQLGLGLSNEEADALLAHLDINRDGMVSYEEFLTQLFRAARDPMLARLGPCLVEHFLAHDGPAYTLWQRIARAFQDRGVPLRQVFDLFDADRDGVISRQELAEAFRLMRLNLSDDDVDRLLRDIDVNQDGRVNIHEFISRLQV
jgi:calmodulin